MDTNGVADHVDVGEYEVEEDSDVLGVFVLITDGEVEECAIGICEGVVDSSSEELVRGFKNYN